MNEFGTQWTLLATMGQYKFRMQATFKEIQYLDAERASIIEKHLDVRALDNLVEHVKVLHGHLQHVRGLSRTQQLVLYAHGHQIIKLQLREREGGISENENHSNIALKT
jgi:hypothetical protein